jgi:hypothetical protein
MILAEAFALFRAVMGTEVYFARPVNESTTGPSGLPTKADEENARFVPLREGFAIEIGG